MVQIVVVKFTQLFQENESEHSMWTKTSIVRSKTFPQTEEPFLFDQPFPHILYIIKVHVIHGCIIYKVICSSLTRVTMNLSLIITLIPRVYPEEEGMVTVI